MFPQKLRQGAGIRIVAPARSLALPLINAEVKETAIQRLEKLGLNVSFATHVNEVDDFQSSSIESRVSDIHEAFLDPSVKSIIAAIGGFNSNQLLQYLDYDLIRAHPKIFCGFSDITAVANAIFAKTGLVTYSGPDFFSFGEKQGFEYTLDYFSKCLFSEQPFTIAASSLWSSDHWSNNQEARNFHSNDGFWIIHEGSAEGKIIGGNQSTLNLLQGSNFMPNLEGSILFLEDDYEAHVATVDRDLQSIIHQPAYEKVRGIVFGRFEPETKMTQELLRKIILTKKELRSIPIIANADFGHTTPHITFPIGGRAQLDVFDSKVDLAIIQH